VEQALLMHQWPGNIRELKHAIERACILSPERELMLEALFETPLPNALRDGDVAEGLATYLQSCERAYIVKALETNEGQIARTAAHLGISRKNLWERMKRLDLPARQDP
jgi:DNA-binding NtrC family response regulator